MNPVAVDVSGLVVDYLSGGYSVRAIDHLDMHANAGELVVLLGPSGSGKTTLLSCLGGILRPTEGRVTVAGTDVTALSERQLEAYRRTEVGFVFQAFNLVASLPARENVAVPLMLTGMRRRAALAVADRLLDRVGLGDRRHHTPGHLSGGEQQRVAIARGFVREPSVLLADEPTANLDYISAETVIDLLRSLRDEGRAVVVSTHDERLVPLADRVVRVAGDADTSDAGPIPVRHSAGEVVFHQGDRSDLVYTIEDGEVDVVRVFADGSERVLARRGPGHYVGELGPILGHPRSATVRARTDVALTGYGVRRFRRSFIDRAGPEAGDAPAGNENAGGESSPR